MGPQPIASCAVMENSGQPFGECFKRPNCCTSFEGQFLYHQHLSCCENYVCRLSGETVREHGKLKSHIWNQHQLQIHTCRACQYITYTSSDEARHKLQSCTLNGLYECETCTQAFLTFAAVQRHSEAHPNRYSFPCRYCSVTHRYKCYIEKHMKYHTTLYELFRCPYCAWTSKTREPVRRHIEKAHIGNFISYIKIRNEPAVFHVLSAN